MNNSAICPLLSAREGQNPLSAFKCVRESCAWWIEDKQKCAVTAIGSVKTR